MDTIYITFTEQRTAKIVKAIFWIISSPVLFIAAILAVQIYYIGWIIRGAIRGFKGLRSQ